MPARPVLILILAVLAAAAVTVALIRALAPGLFGAGGLWLLVALPLVALLLRGALARRRDDD
ncbi:hypothetical protein [Pseudooceanicola aestuarii]|uniref:hypothetical protein n=1 Tax=Pseudooceanicola aestuarii TaxID=2697319 RepID=UPI0013D02754|nr:hypothetical protein [Pseudooceanicola aestuarii]